MYDQLRQADLFQGLNDPEIYRLSTIGRTHSLRAGEYLFLLGDSAECLYVVLRGRFDLCFPISVGGIVKDIAVESLGPAKTLGWSALVRPFRFTLSARAAEATEVIAFTRHDLLELFDSNPVIARVVLGGIFELVGNRLSMFQALWARELRRTLEEAQPDACAK